MADKPKKQPPKRQTRDASKNTGFFEVEPDWREHWWGMPSFDMEDARPGYKITFNFMTWDDVQAFADKLDIDISKKTDSMWYPQQERLNGEFVWDGTKVLPRYPVYIPSKGRWENQTTGTLLKSMGVPFKFAVEPTEAKQYAKAIGKENLLVLPFSDLGQGSIPARNYIWEHAKEHGHTKHWIMDDNILSLCRCTNNRRIGVKTAAPLVAIEDWTDRYENVAFAGPHHKGFVMDRDPRLTPILLNSRIYSCILIDTSLEYRWRGRYNEDTDLCLRAMKDGWCTALFRALMMEKGGTQQMKGGNTDTVYATNDRRLEFAESLKRQHPDIVEVVWKFDRWHHQVDYSQFKRNKLKLKKGITPTKDFNEYGMELTYIK